MEGAASKPIPAWGIGAGEAWGYRRVAYGQMARLLADCGRLPAALEMHADVYAREAGATRHLHMPLTPPMSEAAVEARAAVASVAL